MSDENETTYESEDGRTVHVTTNDNGTETHVQEIDPINDVPDVTSGNK